MKLRALLIALIVATTAIVLVDHASSARAATIQYDASGDVTGIAGLDAGGNLFDIAFIYGGARASFETAYASTFPPHSRDTVAAVRDAIRTLLNAASPNIPDIAGTTGEASAFLIPLDDAVHFITILDTYHTAGNGTNTYFVSSAFISKGFSVPTIYAWTVITPIASSEVPLPAALPLFATILAGGGLIAWRRKRKAAALARRPFFARVT